MLCTVWWACTEGAGPTASGNAVALGIVPSFQIDPALFATDPVDQIRLTAYVASSGTVVGSFDESVSPTADEWVITLDIDLGDAETLQVVVDAELLSAGTVVWSGRLGPITVPSGAPALAMDVYPGPLDNQDVTFVDIFGAPSVMVASTSVTLGAELSLLPGSDATPVIYWASSNEDIATVTPLSGSTVMLTAVAPGTVDIIATAGPAYAEVTVEVLAEGAATTTWVGGAASGSPTDWSNPANWNPTGVPTRTDAVLVPITANPPVLSAGASVESLVVADGTSVDLGGQVLSVASDLAGGASGITNGTVEVTGSGAVLEGSLPTLTLLANRALSGSLFSSGDLVLDDAELDLGDQLVSVVGGLNVFGIGRLVMAATDNNVYVVGDVVFDGADHEGFLTGGSMSLDGDFSVTSSSATGFAATGTHWVSFDGTTPQLVSFTSPGATQQRFQEVSIFNGSGVSFSTDAWIAGGMDVTGRMEIPPGSTVTVAGDLTLSSFSELHVDGTLTVLGQCIDNSATITGTGTQPCGTPTATDFTWVGGTSTSWSEPDNWSPVGPPGPSDAVLIPGSTPTPVLNADVEVASITVSGSNALNLSGFTLTVSGDVSMGVSGGYTGLVHVTGAGTLLEGTLDDLQVSADRAVSTSLSVYGNLTLEGVLDANGQAVTVLGDLSVQGPSAVLRMADPNTNVYVGGHALFNGGSHEGHMTDGYLTLAGGLTATDASPTSFVSSGSHWVEFSSGSEQAVSFQVPGATAQRFRDVEIFSVLGVTFATDVHVTGVLDVGGRLNVATGTTASVDGLTSLYGGSVLIADGSVTGSCVNSGGIIVGDGATGCGTPLAVDRYWTGFSSTSWDLPENWEPVGVPQPSESVLVLYRLNRATLGQDVSVAGLTVHSSAQLDLGGLSLTVAGDVVGQGFVANGTTVVTGTGSQLQGSFETLVVEGARTTTGFVYTDLDLFVRDRLAVGTGGIQTYGNLTVETATGELVMGDAAGVVYVYGDITFDGASLDGDLTGGNLYLYGDFTVGDTNLSGDAFRSTGTSVWFLGSVDQTVSFSNPGPDNGQQSFWNLQVAKSGGSLVFANDAHVTGELNASNQQVFLGEGATFMRVNGALSLFDVTFNGVALELITNVTSELHSIDSVTFTGMDPAITQLFLSLPPGAGGEALNVDSPVFSTLPVGGYYIEAANSAANLLTVQVNSPDPPTVDSSLYATAGNAEIVWGP